MTITITNKEYEAISFAATQLEKNFLNNAENSLSDLYRIMEKYRKARYKAREFQDVRRIVAEKNKGRCLIPREIDKLARKYCRYLKQNKIL